MKVILNFLTNIMTLIIKALSGFIKKPGLKKLRGNKDRPLCENYCNSRTTASGFWDNRQ